MNIDKQVIFDAVIDQDAGWQTLVNDNWGCLLPDDWRRILVLAGGGGGGGGGGLTYVAVPADSNAAGVSGQVAVDGDYFYYYEPVLGKWRRTPGNIF